MKVQYPEILIQFMSVDALLKFVIEIQEEPDTSPMPTERSPDTLIDRALAPTLPSRQR